MDREPAAWETDAAGPFPTLEDVSVWALGNQRFRIESPSVDEEVGGFAEARKRARQLAGV